MLRSPDAGLEFPEKLLKECRMFFNVRSRLGRPARVTLVRSIDNRDINGACKGVINALEEAMNETGLNRATIVTIGEEEKVDVETGKVDILPAWLWALNRP